MSSTKGDLRSKTKTYKRYPPNDALKKGSPSTIESSCVKIKIAQEYVNLREKYKSIKIENQKNDIKIQQMEQMKKDNFKLISDSQKKTDTIKKLHTTITQLNSQIQLLKDTTNDRGDYQRLEGFIKKKDHEIQELKNQIDSTKINAVTSLQNQIHQLKAEHIHFNTIWKTEGITEQDIIDMKRQISNQCDLIKESKEENTKLQDELTELRKTLHSERDKFFTLCNKDNEEIKRLKEKITDLYDSL